MISTPFSKTQLIPQEEKLDIGRRKGKLFIGVAKENGPQEQRVPLTPEAVAMLTAHGHHVLIEHNAGLPASYSNKEYAEAGAEITQDTKKIFSCSIVLKIEPPTSEQIEQMQPGAFIFSTLQLKTLHRNYFELLCKKKITALCYDYIKDHSGSFPFLQAISEIAGIASISIGAELMSSTNQGKGLLLGNITGVPPTEIVILGAGTVAEYAARTALGFGANVKIFDNSIHRLKRIQQLLPHRVITSTIQEKVLLKALMRCDMAIGALRGKERSPVVVLESMVEKMKSGAVIIDVCIDNGGCFETSELTSHEHPTRIKNEVIHYGVPNLTSRYCKTASQVISNILSPYLLDLSDNGGIEKALYQDPSICSGIYIFKGILVNQQIANWHELDFKDINLFMV